MLKKLLSLITRSAPKRKRSPRPVANIVASFTSAKVHAIAELTERREHLEADMQEAQERMKELLKQGADLRHERDQANAIAQDLEALRAGIN